MNTIILFLLLALLPFVNAVLIDPHSHENLQSVCNRDTKLWESRIDGRNNSFNLFLRPCTIADSVTNHTLIASGKFYTGIIKCTSDVDMCMFIDNVNDYVIDVRYVIEDITPPYNIYMPFFYVAITVGIVVSISAFIAAFGLGLYVGKKSQGKIEVIPGDRALIDHLLNKADNMEHVQQL